jgi:hypothetical protein
VQVDHLVCVECALYTFGDVELGMVTRAWNACDERSLVVPLSEGSMGRRAHLRQGPLSCPGNFRTGTHQVGKF